MYVIGYTNCKVSYIKCPQVLNNGVSLHKSNINFSKIARYMFQNNLFNRVIPFYFMIPIYQANDYAVVEVIKEQKLIHE